MKRIILFLFIISSVSLFSQSKIWGVKAFAGNLNGGILFSIDSATSQIEIQHRFSGIASFRQKTLLEEISKKDLDPVLGRYPKKIIQMNNGKIVGFTSLGGDSTDIYGGYGVVYDFDPATQGYQLLFASQDLEYGKYAYDIFKISNNRVLFFNKDYIDIGEYHFYSYLYDATDESILFLDSLQSSYSGFDILQESDTSFIYYLKSEKKLLRFLPLTNSLEDISDFELNGKANYLCFYEPNVLIYEYEEDDIRLLKKYNVQTDTYEVVCDLSDYRANKEERDFHFDFSVAEEGDLIGEFKELTMKSKNWYWISTLAKLSLESFVMNEVFSYTDADGYYSSHYYYIDDYSVTGTVYAVKRYDSFSSDCGFLKQVNYENGEIVELDSFELVTDFPEEDSPLSHIYLTKFKNINESSSTQELEKLNIKIYYGQERLFIQSKEYINQAQINIFDMSGRLVYVMVEHDFYHMEKAVYFKSGAYVVQVKADSKIISEKIMVME